MIHNRSEVGLLLSLWPDREFCEFMFAEMLPNEIGPRSFLMPPVASPYQYLCLTYSMRKPGHTFPRLYLTGTYHLDSGRVSYHGASLTGSIRLEAHQFRVESSQQMVSFIEKAQERGFVLSNENYEAVSDLMARVDSTK